MPAIHQEYRPIIFRFITNHLQFAKRWYLDLTGIWCGVARGDYPAATPLTHHGCRCGRAGAFKPAYRRPPDRVFQSVGPGEAGIVVCRYPRHPIRAFFARPQVLRAHLLSPSKWGS